MADEWMAGRVSSQSSQWQMNGWTNDLQWNGLSCIYLKMSFYTKQTCGAFSDQADKDTRYQWIG